MKIRTTLALAAATLTLGVPVAAADPDGYQPIGQPDAIDRYLANNGPDGFQPQLQSSAPPDAVDRYLAALGQAGQPDAVARYLRNHPSGVTADGRVATSGGTHPDNRAVRPGVIVPVERPAAGGFSWEGSLLGALGGAMLVLLAIVGASTMRERRRLVLR